MQTQDKVTARHYSGNSINDYYPKVCRELMEFGDVTFPRGLETSELHPTTVHIYQPRERLVTSHGRMINVPFALAEVVQIIGGLNDAQALKHYNSQIIKIQGDTEDVTRFNAAYGERMRRFEVYDGEIGFAITQDQLFHVIQTLREDPDSRQASIVLSHPFYDNFMRTTKDRACNVYAHAMIRDGKLDWMQIMRSNDVIWGLPYNFVQWLHVMEWVASALNVPMGNYFLVQDSLHVYDKHYDDCRNVKPFDLYRYIPQEPLNMGLSNDKWFKDNVINWEEWIRTGGPTVLVTSKEATSYWYQVVMVFNSYAAFKQKRDLLAYDLMPTHPELRWPLMRNYVQWRWASKNVTVEQGALLDNVTSELIKHIPGNEVKKWLNG